jgi:hypothetical protein
MRSTALAPRLRRNGSRAIVQPPASSWVQSGLRTQAAPWPQPLMRYVTGWAQADPGMIAGDVADEYRFHDPLVGVFIAPRLSRYFELLDARFASDGVRAQPAFYLHGPMDGSGQGEFAFFREAPQFGLTGTARILVGRRGVIAETVAYDLNMATELLRSPQIDVTRGGEGRGQTSRSSD